MTVYKHFFLYVFSFIISLILLLIGFYAIFMPKKLIFFLIKLTTRHSLLSILFPNLQNMIKIKWFYFNMRLCGLFATLMALLFCFVAINAIINCK